MSNPSMSPPPYWCGEQPLQQLSIPVSPPNGPSRYSWPPEHNYFFPMESPLSLTTSNAPLTHAALWQHTTKSEPCPSPSLSSGRGASHSPVLSSVASVLSDDPASKRRRTDPNIIASSADPVARTGRSLSPQSPHPQPKSAGGASRSRYRAILPAPAKRQASASESVSSPQTPRRQAASAPASPYSRQSSLGGGFSGAQQGGPFVHTPTDLPPRRYPSGDSPFRPEKLEGTIPGSMLDTLPLLEARFDRLEIAISKYAESRVKKALRNSVVEGLDPDDK